ncbi:hypothetical protein OBK25_05440 [Empedobacter falsenii]
MNKVVTDGTTVSTTEYLDGFQYKDGVLQFFPTAEGYVNAITAGAVGYNYVYNMTDHLGNVRVSYAWYNVNSKLKTVNEDHYYPFGLQHQGYNKPPKDITGGIGSVEIGIGLGTSSGSANYKYKYQGQERQEELGLNWDSFKWRNYDYAIGRFMSIDPLAEKYSYNSTYAFQENKMGLGRELEGLELVFTHGTWSNSQTWNSNFKESMTNATGRNGSPSYQLNWSGGNSDQARHSAAATLVNFLTSNDNPLNQEKHATLIGHSHGGNVNKLVKNDLESQGWNVDLINISTPQRDDYSTNSGNGTYLNFYSDFDLIQYIGSVNSVSGLVDGARTDKNATNVEVNNWKDMGGKKYGNTVVAPLVYILEGAGNAIEWMLNDSAGHGLHNSPAQNQIIKETEKEFQK